MKKNNPGCCCGPPPPPTVDMTPCCTAVPETLSVTITNCNHVDEPAYPNWFHTFSTTLNYVATPAGYAALSMGAHIFLSADQFVDAIGEHFKLRLLCSGAGQFDIEFIYLTHSIFGSPYNAGSRYSWVIGGSNTCSPFMLASGTPFAGEDPGCTVVVSG